MYTDYYLKFTDKETADTELAGVSDVDGLAVDAIGVVVADEGYIQRDDYHVNIRVAEGVSLPSNLTKYTIAKPSNPKRVWA